MLAQTHPGQARTIADPLAACPHPVSLETLAVVEQVLAEMLSSLRRRAGERGMLQAAEAEYQSWFRHLH